LAKDNLQFPSSRKPAWVVVLSPPGGDSERPRALIGGQGWSSGLKGRAVFLACWCAKLGRGRRRFVMFL